MKVNQRINDPLVLLIDGHLTSFRGLLLLSGGKCGVRGRGFPRPRCGAGGGPAAATPRSRTHGPYLAGPNPTAVGRLAARAAVSSGDTELQAAPLLNWEIDLIN